MRSSFPILATLAVLWAEPAQGQARTEVLTNVNVVNVVDGTIQRSRTVVIERGIIRSVSASRASSVAGSRARDMGGAYVIPGLWDMHAHVGASGRSSLPLMIAAGVTGARDMGSIAEIVRPWRDSIKSGRMVGPRLLLASPIVENAAWLDAVRGFARRSGDRALIQDLARRIPVATPLGARRAVIQLLAEVRRSSRYETIRRRPRCSLFFVRRVSGSCW